MTHDASQTRSRHSEGGNAPAPRHLPGLDAACRLVAKAVSDDAATVFRALARVPETERDGALDLTRIDGLRVFGSDAAEIGRRLAAVGKDFAAGFGFALLVPSDPCVVGRKGHDVAAGADRGSPPVCLSSAFATLLVPAATRIPTPGARLDARTTAWGAVVAAAAQSHAGHHLVLRRAAPCDRAILDFAACVGSYGVRVVYRAAPGGLRREILSAELHAGAQPDVVVLDGHALVAAPPSADDVDDAWSEGPIARDPALVATDEAAAARGWLDDVRNTYVWCIPAVGALPHPLTGVIGGCIGPVQFDGDWSTALIDGAVPGLGPVGARTLLTQGADPRETIARAKMARIAVAALRLAPVAACRMIATSFGPLDVAPSPAPACDPRLFVCDPDGHALLARAPHLARGARVLVFGPPGGGKSTYALALAGRLGSGCGQANGIVMVEPARFLAKGWGATERLLAEVWKEAGRDGATLVVDEFDSMCGVREPCAPASGNAYLIRTLTNEWLRRLDAEPDISVIATVNDLEAIDPTARRRFQIVVEVKAELDADRERLAWTLLFGLDCPADWKPSGAAIADFAAAVARCRMLGQSDVESHTRALAHARRARLGTQDRVAAGRRARPLH